MNEEESNINNIEKTNIVPTTQKIREYEKSLAEIRKELNESTRQAIHLKANNKSLTDKQFEKCFTLERKFFNEIKKVTKRVFYQINEDQGNIIQMSKKFEMLNEDIERITKLNSAIELRLKILESEVGIKQ